MIESVATGNNDAPFGDASLPLVEGPHDRPVQVGAPDLISDSLTALALNLDLRRAAVGARVPHLVAPICARIENSTQLFSRSFR
jgi:hypothetical protein